MLTGKSSDFLKNAMAEPPLALSFDALKAKQRRLRDDFGQELSLRVHRAISWLQGAERAAAADDSDTAFICYWIAFNAAYVQGPDLHKQFPEHQFVSWYFDTIVALDDDRVVYDAIWTRFSGVIRTFLNNHYVYRPFWQFQHGEQEFENWRQRFEQERHRVHRALARQDTVRILEALFDRLYVLRNQLMHGGATWSGNVNRDQVRDGTAILGSLVPRFVDLMMAHPNEPWGVPPYPVVESTPSAGA